jgi:Zn-dependent peptidase ImmA (M78 family)
MKDTVQTIHEFLSAYGITIEKINLRLSTKGQIESCTGEYYSAPTKPLEIIEKVYRKTLVATDYIFMNTELELLQNKFIITSKER